MKRSQRNPRTRQDKPDEELRTPASESTEPTQYADELEEFDDDVEIDPDDERWDAFLLDDDDENPQPEYGDFWTAD
jgi:hypothetical protein